MSSTFSELRSDLNAQTSNNRFNMLLAGTLSVTSVVIGTLMQWIYNGWGDQKQKDNKAIRNIANMLLIFSAIVGIALLFLIWNNYTSFKKA
jgi:UDP-N-acetylmuramyl pentapeptide phosphotransferase/UDP-N-acetylglucosamine-1-phosphate transferase